MKFLRSPTIFFTLANDEKCEMWGVMNVILNSCFKSQVLIIESSKESPPLIGRTWLSLLFPQWKSCFLENGMFSVPQQGQVKSDAIKMSLVSDVEQIERNFSDVFKSRDSPIKNFTVTLRLKEGSVPKFKKAK